MRWINAFNVSAILVAVTLTGCGDWIDILPIPKPTAAPIETPTPIPMLTPTSIPHPTATMTVKERMYRAICKLSPGIHGRFGRLPVEEWGYNKENSGDN